jgi:hypothetical protein
MRVNHRVSTVGDREEERARQPPVKAHHHIILSLKAKVVSIVNLSIALPQINKDRLIRFNQRK